MKKVVIAALFALSTLFVCMGENCFFAGTGDGSGVIVTG